MMPLWVALIIIAAAAIAFVCLRLEPTTAAKPSRELRARRESSPIKVRLSEIFDEERRPGRQDLPRENAQICNLSWFDDTIPLSDTDFSHCQFIRCKLIDDGGPFSMEDCFMDNCTIYSASVRQPANESREERRYSGPKQGIPKRPLTKSELWY